MQHVNFDRNTFLFILAVMFILVVLVVKWMVKLIRREMHPDEEAVKKAYKKLKEKIAYCSSTTELSILEIQLTNFYTTHWSIRNDELVKKYYQVLYGEISSKNWELKNYRAGNSTAKIIFFGILLSALFLVSCATRPAWAPGNKGCKATQGMTGY